MSFVLAEGTYISYAIYDSFDDSNINYLDTCGAWINCLETKAILITAQPTCHMKVYDIDTKALGTPTTLTSYEFSDGVSQGWKFRATVLNTYMVVIESSTGNILIYKNGVLLQTITEADLGLSSSAYRTISFSPRGKYIFITGTRVASSLKGWVVLKGT